VQLPEDLTGAAEPRDVLAAEEFAMPAGPARLADAAIGPAGALPRAGGGGLSGLLVLGGLVVVARRLVRRLRRR
jgi:hypothetical protein